MHSQVENIHGVTLTTKPKIYDARGWFLPAMGNDDPQQQWILQNISQSLPGVLRGMHYQDPHPQAKLLTLIEGSLQDIVADLRPDSPTHGKFAVYQLDADEKNQLHIPKGCAHGFLVTGTKPALISYLADAPYHPESEKTLAWNHPDWNFPWLTDSPILSQKDQEET
ncbi:MAG: dTDP-4-dehydrorhamnose 3,5-epimerase family protein [Luteolibacter sp.]